MSFSACASCNLSVSESSISAPRSGGVVTAVSSATSSSTSTGIGGCTFLPFFLSFLLFFSVSGISLASAVGGSIFPCCSSCGWSFDSVGSFPSSRLSTLSPSAPSAGSLCASAEKNFFDFLAFFDFLLGGTYSKSSTGSSATSLTSSWGAARISPWTAVDADAVSTNSGSSAASLAAAEVVKSLSSRASAFVLLSFFLSFLLFEMLMISPSLAFSGVGSAPDTAFPNWSSSAPMSSSGGKLSST